MIEVKEAVKRAMDYVKDVYPPDQLNNLRLEEVRPSKASGQGSWEITVGFDPPPYTMSALGEAVGLRPRVERQYKMVRLRRDNGEVEGMLIREVD